jgi:hypothetical protein
MREKYLLLKDRNIQCDKFTSRFYGFETWSFSFREEERREEKKRKEKKKREEKKKEKRREEKIREEKRREEERREERTFGSKKDSVRIVWREFPDKSFHSSYFSP